MSHDLAFLARRGFLKRSALCAGAAFALGGGRRTYAQAPALQSTKLSDKALFVQGPDSNVLALDGSEGLILVDGGHADGVEALHGLIAQHFPNRPYRALFNTHWHPEQTGANLPLGEQGAEIIAHENTMLWESTEIWQRWSGLTFAPLPSAALPKTTVFEDGSLTIGDRAPYYGYMRESHTDGDIWVYFEDDNVLVTGGLVSNGRWPDIDWWTGGFIGGMMDGFVSLMTVPNENTKIVPAYGNIMSLQELRAQNQMYLTVFDRIHASFIKSDTLEDLLRSKPTAEFDAAMGDPTRFLTLAFQSIQGHLRDPQSDRFLNIP
ncbi:MAG: MBL fold metallo-hydrolase [Pseudomonadales bacterium]|jgi:glyoxylase-like metal-dependent hydrolase (beta-lactamase superfamily II)|nr:MBL fold metallo-hydrolase [Pseudomonadales bacterium]